jgi:hypothetical protein
MRGYWGTTRGSALSLSVWDPKLWAACTLKKDRVRFNSGSRSEYRTAGVYEAIDLATPSLIPLHGKLYWACIKLVAALGQGRSFFSFLLKATPFIQFKIPNASHLVLISTVSSLILHSFNHTLLRYNSQVLLARLLILTSLAISFVLSDFIYKKCQSNTPGSEAKVTTASLQSLHLPPRITQPSQLVHLRCKIITLL